MVLKCCHPPFSSLISLSLASSLQEFVFNKGQRIFFEQSSANGILLFRETSSILCAYGSRILQVPVKTDIYLEKYKGLTSDLSLFHRVISFLFSMTVYPIVLHQLYLHRTVLLSMLTALHCTILHYITP
jgi:hypothetical protein